MKKIFSFVLALIMVTGLLPIISAPQAQAADTPIWKVAFIIIPEVSVQVGSEPSPRVITQQYTDAIIGTRTDRFKTYIETHTNNAVEMQITHIYADETPAFVSEHNNIIRLSKFQTIMTPAMIDKYNLNDYDTWVGWWPFNSEGIVTIVDGVTIFGYGPNANYNSGTNANPLFACYTIDERQIYMASGFAETAGNVNLNGLIVSGIDKTLVHEFLHMTEFWFRDKLGFPLPYRIPAGVSIPDLSDRNPLHNPGFFGYNQNYSSNNAQTHAFMIDWLSQKIPDPQNPGRMLGIPADAWNYSPTNGKKPAYDPQNPPLGDPATEVIVPSDTPDISEINLTRETITLPTGFTVAAFSVDGGTKWKRGALPAADRFPRLLNNKNGMTLHITNNFDQSAKNPATGAQTIEFPAIGARPKRNAEKLRPSYGDSHWVLAKKDTTAAVFTGYEFAPSSNGKTPNNGQWFIMPEDGIPIASGSARQTFLVRAAPNGSPTAASTHWRVRPVNFGKVPTYSIRQVKVSGSSDKVAAIAFRKGDQYAIGNGDFTPALTDKVTIPVSQLREQGTTLRVRRATTGKRPASLTQTITLPATT
jgi:hypothetical protein